MSINAHFLQDQKKEKFYPYSHAGVIYDKNGNIVQDLLDDIDTSIEDISSNLSDVSVQPDWEETSSSSYAYIKNKPSSMPASDVYAWAKATTKPDYAWNEIKSKPSTYTPSSHDHDNATTTQDGFLSKEDKTKLNGIANNANNYTHPAYTSRTSGLYKVTVDSSGHVSSASPVSKSDITNLGIPGSDTNTWVALKGATSSVAGTAGYAPAPSAGAANRYLRSDGTWAVPPDTNTTYTLSSFGITATAAELNKLDGVTATATELNYVDGVTSNIQTQLNNKAASSHNHSAANITSGTLAITRGGTGATTAAKARTNLGVTNITVQAAEPTTQGNGDFWFKEL